MFSGATLGGAAMQLQALATEFHVLGHQVKISCESDLNLTQTDVVHFTQINSEIYRYWINAKKHGVPFVVKSINTSESANNDIAAESILHVESPDEASRVSERYGTAIENNIRILLPGVDSNIRHFTADRVWVHTNGRYMKLKNHVAVIRACKVAGLPVITAGGSYDDSSYQDCLDEKYGTILTECDKNKLADIYNRTRVYVCASINEMCSASVCEAILCGCLIVSSSAHLGNSNYYKPGYWVYESGNQDDLLAKIIEAYHADVHQTNPAWTVKFLAEKLLEIFRRYIRVKKRKIFL